MSTLIILSSSPPRDLARSPTPADSSPRLPSPGAVLRGDSPGRRRFKTATSATRDRFPSAFSTARQVLASKDGAENMIISPGKNRFRQDLKDTRKVGSPDLRHSILEAPNQFELQDVLHDQRPSKYFMEPEGPTVVQISASDAKRRKTRQTSPLLLQRATTRRLDWTPPKVMTNSISKDNTDTEGAFPDDLLESFEYAHGPKTKPALDLEIQPNKRRKLNISEKQPRKSINVSKAPVLGAAATKLPTKRSKSPTKKSRTITGLATASFVVPEEPESTPLMQYLVSTQAQMQDQGAASVDDLQTEVQKTKTAAKKVRESKKKNPPQSRLVSPSSAMRSFEQQEAIFGSASQLMRDESPTFLRDTIEATKNSEAMFSDPFSSPARTQAISIESITPLTGTSKFRRSRNLWSVAGRDEDNALLHVDTVDLTDSPAIQNAFAGKEVMVQPGEPSKIPGRPSALQSITSLVSTASRVFDLGNTNSPTLQKSLHTAAGQSEPQASTTAEAKTTQTPGAEPPVKASGMTTVRAKAKAPAKAKKAPKKPNYPGLTDHDLKKQISAYGFKAVKKREKMIELLEKCWEEKYGPNEAEAEVEKEVEVEHEKSGYSDILSNVHDILARPVPKTKAKAKIPRVRKQKAEATATESTKKPRQRKKKQEGDVQAEPAKKPARKRKAKAPALSEEVVHDVDEIVGKEVQKPTSGTDQGSKEKQTVPLPTPPTTDPSMSNPLPEEVPLHAEESAVSTVPALVAQQEQPLTPEAPQLLDQITRAIFHESYPSNLTAQRQRPSPNTFSESPTSTKQNSVTKKSSPHEEKGKEKQRNHQKNPTWHEKMLLYDPIILEDLATWLNVQGFKEIGEDREISAVDVRTWCESRGICCLWKGGWRGSKGAGAGASAAGTSGD